MARPATKLEARRGLWSVAVAALLFVGCTGSDSAGVISLDLAPPTSTTEPTPTTTPTTDTPTDEAEETNMDKSRPIKSTATHCVRLTDFTTEADRRAWQTVNDNVMGGRSSGGPSFFDGLMVFSGETNTDGGGFSSLRLPLAENALREFDRVTFRARPDGREYMVTFDDNVSSRDRRVSHRAPLGFGPADEWQEVSVVFEDLFPAIFGRPIDDLPFDKNLAMRMGIMISDGLDGPFRLEIDWIDLCT